MHNPYEDIRSRIAEEPKWWDEQAVPRYCEFGPQEAANPSADEVCLVSITCQECGRPFLVCFSGSRMGRYSRARRHLHLDGVHEPSNEELQKAMKEAALDVAIRSRKLHFGDPPTIFCCVAGWTMNSVPQRVVEFWRRGDEEPRWSRVEDLEVEIQPDWWTRRDEIDEDALAEIEALLADAEDGASG